MNKNNKPYAVLINMDYLTGLQTARILADNGVPVIGMAENLDHFCTKTNTCEKVIQSGKMSDELIENLIKLGNELDQKAVLYPCQDSAVLLVSQNREKLEPYYHISLPANDTVEMLMNKPLFYEFAKEKNLPVAKFLLLKNRTDALEAVDNLNFPCVLKPHMRSPKWEENTRLKAFKVLNKDEFLKMYDRIYEWSDTLMLQEWIEGDDTSLYSCNCYYNKNSEPLVNFTAKKLRQWPIVTGNTSLGIDVMDDTVLQVTTDLFKKVNYAGLGYVEIKKDIKTEEYYIIEPNIGRPTGRSALAEACGVDLIYTMYCDCLKLPLPDTRVQKIKNIKWIHLRTDLQSSYNYWKNGKLTIREWLKTMRGKKFYAVISLRDPLPFLTELKAGIVYGIKSLFGRSD
ncbi:MAG: carboxylate--amine ligase [Ignavibacteria bacterium]|jgi:predicted ATP-grasp superfamily ATP-dependent carboligase